MTNRYGNFNPQVNSQHEFKNKVKNTLEENNGSWVKTPDLQKEIAGGKWKGYKEWSPEWTRNILYGVRKYLEETEDRFESEKRAGPGQDHWYWRLSK